MSEYITLHCIDCDNIDCNIVPCGTMVDYDSLKGCTRKLDDNLFVEYQHYIEEVLPFLSMYKPHTRSQYFNDILDCCNKVYNSPIGVTLDKNGKVKNYASQVSND